MTTPAPLTPAQQNVANIENNIMKYLTPSTQALVGVAQAIGTPNQDGLMATFGSLAALTNAAATIPNPSVQTYAGLAAVIEQLVATGVGVVEGATTPATVVANAHPSFLFKFLHPNIAKQEEALAAAETPIIVPPALPK